MKAMTPSTIQYFLIAPSSPPGNDAALKTGPVAVFTIQKEPKESPLHLFGAVRRQQTFRAVKILCFRLKVMGKDSLLHSLDTKASTNQILCVTDVFRHPLVLLSSFSLCPLSCEEF